MDRYGTEILLDAFGRVNEAVQRAMDGADQELLAFRPEPGTNSIAWLVWHLTRVQDTHVSRFALREPRWTEEGWHDRFALPFEPADRGIGHSAEDVALLGAVPGPLLLGYFDAVHEATMSILGELDFAEIVDTTYDPPVSVGVRLVSVISDNIQHAGQALFVRGIYERG
jgi:Protein of unknown function (DUF664)